jgi:two-component system cell cycle sensor histidine kinase/response regulator CckA
MKEKTESNFFVRYGRYITFLGLFMLACYVLLYLTYQNVKREMIENLNAKQMILAKQAAKGIETFFNDHVAMLQYLAKNEHIIDLDETGKGLIREFYSAHSEMISIVTRIDRDGRILHPEPYDPKVIHQTVTAIEDFLEVKRTRQVAVSDVFTNRRASKTIIVHVPVFKEGSFNGTLAILLPFDFIARRYIEDIRIGQDGYAWMISRNGIELSCPVPGHVGNSVSDNCRDFPDILAMAERMKRREHGVATYQFNKIRENVVHKIMKQAVFMPIRMENNFWSIVIATPEDEVMGALLGFRNRLLLIAIFLVIGMGLFFYVLFRTRILVEEIERRRKTEGALRESEKSLCLSEEKYRILAENASDIIWSLDLNLSFTYISPSVENIQGWTMEEWKSLRLQDILPPYHLDRIVKVFEEELALEKTPGTDPKRTWRSELEEYVKDGSTIWVEVTASFLRNTEGEPVGIMGITRDITERKRTEKALRNSEERFSKAFHISPAPTIISTIDDGRYVDVNDSFLLMLGYSREEMIGHTASALNVWVNYADRKRAVRNLTEQGPIRGEVLHLRTKSGEIRDVLVSAEIITLNEQNFILSIFYDITNQRKLENQLRQIHKMEAIGTLAGGIAHDFNNILSAVIGYAEMALGEPKIDDRLRRYLSQIYKAGERARDLVKQILTFSRQQEQQRKPVLVAPVVKEGIKLLRSSLPSTIQITMSITKAPTMILADPTQIHQIMMNLCTNASHAMREKGGTLDIRLVREGVEQARTFNSFDLPAGNYAKLTVGDTGCGIDPSIMNRIFDPFYTTKPPGEGTGLGLSVVYGIVRDHDGAIDVTSKPGKGTTVSVYLPLVENGEVLSERMSERIPGGSERILFVDDEAALVELGSTMLASLGYHITSRTSSIEALEAFRAAPHDFDLVITDTTMPNMRGDGLAGELLKIRPDISIILCTGFSEMISEEKAKSVGIRQFIMKPIFKNDLAKAVRDVLDRSGHGTKDP